MELRKFSDAMLCVESQYQGYLISKGMPIDKYELLLNEVSRGSILIEFIKGGAEKLFEEYVFPMFTRSLEQRVAAILAQRHLNDEDFLKVKDFKEIMGITAVPTKLANPIISH